MNIQRRRMELKRRQIEQNPIQVLSRDHLILKARGLGVSHLCAGWKEATIMKHIKLKEQENGRG